MKIKFIFSLFGFLLAYLSAFTQTDEQLYKAIKGQNYGYKFTHDIEQLKPTESVCFEYTMIGKDEMAQKCYDTFYNYEQVSSNISYEANEARDFIIKYLQENNPKIIAINEAHHISQHRVVMQSLLPILYEQGYKCLAVEGLRHDDILLNKRKYPKFLHSGYYLRDPEYANMIRTALEVGFELIAYDQRGPSRDEKAANHIYNYMQENKTEKIVIYAGYDHIREKEINGKTSLVTYLNQYLKTDAFTISQTEKLPNSIKLDTSMSDIFYLSSSDNAQIFKGPTNDIDLAIYCDTEQNKYGNISPKRMPYKVKYNLKDIKFPLQISAKISNEGLLAIPMDVIEVLNNEELENAVLHLELGRQYNIEFLNRDYDLIYTEVIGL